MAVRAPSGRDYGRAYKIDTKQGMLDIFDPDMLAAMLYSSSSRGRDVAFDDLKMTNITFNTDPWTVTKDAGVSAPTPAVIAGGGVEITTGTGNGDGLNMVGLAAYSGNANAGIEVRFKVSAITAVGVNIGFANAVTTDNTALAVTDGDGTPTFQASATEAAIWSFRPQDTITTPRFVTNGVGQTAVGETILGPDGAALAVVADTYMSVRVQLLGDTGSALCATFGASNNLLSATVIDKIAGGTVGGITPATLLVPYIGIQNTTTTSRVVTIQYIRKWMDLYAFGSGN